MVDKEKVRAMRNDGLTYRKIGEMFGITSQRVAQICGAQSFPHFRRIEKESCIYPNLMKWMNDNGVSRRELARRINGGDACDAWYISNIMAGKTLPTKPTIDKLLSVTGIKYEELFYEG